MQRNDLVKELIYVTQRYLHRQDKLEERGHDVRSNVVSESYLPGRSDHLKGKLPDAKEMTATEDGHRLCLSSEHTYDFGAEFERTMIYYDTARLDGLAKRHETLLELTDYFIKRDDFLEYRAAVFEPRQKKFAPADKDTQRPILVRILRRSSDCLRTITFVRLAF